MLWKFHYILHVDLECGLDTWPCVSRSLADVDNDGKLTCEEFVLAMYLVDTAKAGNTLPQKLPPDLVPPSYRRGRPVGGAVGMPPGGIMGVASAPQVSPGQYPGDGVNVWWTYLHLYCQTVQIYNIDRWSTVSLCVENLIVCTVLRLRLFGNVVYGFVKADLGHVTGKR